MLHESGLFEVFFTELLIYLLQHFVQGLANSIFYDTMRDELRCVVDALFSSDLFQKNFVSLPKDIL